MTKDDIAVLMLVVCLIAIILAVALTLLVLRCTAQTTKGAEYVPPASGQTVINPTFVGDGGKHRESLTDPDNTHFDEVSALQYMFSPT